jgi:uncharacterized membrane protein
MLGPDKDAQRRAAASAPDSAARASDVLPAAGGALGGVIGAIYGNPMLGAQIGTSAGGLVGRTIDGGTMNPDEFVDFALKAKQARSAMNADDSESAQSSALSNAAGIVDPALTDLAKQAGEFL